jgi:hypothetical protein
VNVTAKPKRHKWKKLREHVRICCRCATGKVSEFRGGVWVTTFHRPNGESIESSPVPPCEPGPETGRWLALKGVERVL